MKMKMMQKEAEYNGYYVLSGIIKVWIKKEPDYILLCLRLSAVPRFMLSTIDAIADAFLLVSL